MILHTYDHYLLAAMALFGTFASFAALMWLAHKTRHEGWISQFRGLSPPFVNVVGVLFALTLAFLANDTWNAHDRATNATFQEAGHLRSILALTAVLPAASHAKVEQAVKAYARLTVEDEWPKLAARSSSREASAALDGLLTLLSSAEIASQLNGTSHAQILLQAVQIRENREQRVALCQTHVNPLKWLGMAFLGLLTMISIAMVYVQQPKAEMLAVILFAVAAAPTAAIVLIQGNPFLNPGATSPAPIAALLGM